MQWQENQSIILGSTNRNRALCKDSIVLLEREREREREREGNHGETRRT